MLHMSEYVTKYTLIYSYFISREIHKLEFTSSMSEWIHVGSRPTVIEVRFYSDHFPKEIWALYNVSTLPKSKYPSILHSVAST